MSVQNPKNNVVNEEFEIVDMHIHSSFSYDYKYSDEVQKKLNDEALSFLKVAKESGVVCENGKTKHLSNEEYFVVQLLEYQRQRAALSHKRVCFSITDHENCLGSVFAYNFIKHNKERYKDLFFVPGIEVNVDLFELGTESSGKNLYHKMHMLGYEYNVNDKEIIAFSKLGQMEFPAKGANNINIGKQIISAINAIEKQYKINIKYQDFKPLLCETKANKIQKMFTSIIKDKYNIKADFKEEGDFYADQNKSQKQRKDKNEKKNKKYFYEAETNTKYYYEKNPKHKKQNSTNYNNSKLMLDPFLDKYVDLAQGKSKIALSKFKKLIKDAGGFVGIAHPKSVKYCAVSIIKLNPKYINKSGNKTQDHIAFMYDEYKKLFNLIDEKCGKDTIEIVEVNHRYSRFDKACLAICRLCTDKNIMMSGGSDNHNQPIDQKNQTNFIGEAGKHRKAILKRPYCVTKNGKISRLYFADKLKEKRGFLNEKLNEKGRFYITFISKKFSGKPIYKVSAAEFSKIVNNKNKKITDDQKTMLKKFANSLSFDENRKEKNTGLKYKEINELSAYEEETRQIQKDKLKDDDNYNKDYDLTF